MSLHRRAARRDENHQDVVDHMELYGWHVTTVSSPGFPDTVVVRDGTLAVVEIKTEAGKMKEAQVKLHAAWEATGYLIPVVTSGPEAVEVLAGQRQPRTYRDFPWEGVPEAEKRKRLAVTPAR